MTTKNQTYKIGQIVYILSENADSIIPAMVVEKTVVEKITGNHVSWKIRIGGEEKNKVFDVSSLKLEIYLTLDDALASLKEGFDSFLANLKKEAELKSSKWYAKQISIEPSISSIENEIKSIVTKKPNEKPPTSVNSVRNKLKELLEPTQEELQTEEAINE